MPWNDNYKYMPVTKEDLGYDNNFAWNIQIRNALREDEINTEENIKLIKECWKLERSRERKRVPIWILKRVI